MADSNSGKGSNSNQSNESKEQFDQFDRLQQVDNQDLDAIETDAEDTEADSEPLLATDDNTKARVGIYVVLFEAFNLDGNKEVLKEVITVASPLK